MLVFICATIPGIPISDLPTAASCKRQPSPIEICLPNCRNAKNSASSSCINYVTGVIIKNSCLPDFLVSAHKEEHALVSFNSSGFRDLISVLMWLNWSVSVRTWKQSAGTWRRFTCLSGDSLVCTADQSRWCRGQLMEHQVHSLRWYI